MNRSNSEPTPVSADARAAPATCADVRVNVSSEPALCAVCGAPVDSESGRCYACGFSRRELAAWRDRHRDAWRALVRIMWWNVGVFWAAVVLLALWFTGLALLAQAVGWTPPTAVEALVFWLVPLAGLATLLWSTIRLDHLIRGFPGWGSPAALGVGRVMRVRGRARRSGIPARTHWFPGAALGGAVLVSALMAEGALGDFGRGVVFSSAGIAFIAAAARVATLCERMEAWRALLDSGAVPRRLVSRAARVWMAWCVVAMLLAFTVAWMRMDPRWRGEAEPMLDVLAFLCAVIAMLVWVLSYRGAAKELGRWLR